MKKYCVAKPEKREFFHYTNQYPSVFPEWLQKFTVCPTLDYDERVFVMVKNQFVEKGYAEITILKSGCYLVNYEDYPRIFEEKDFDTNFDILVTD